MEIDKVIVYILCLVEFIYYLLVMLILDVLCVVFEKVELFKVWYVNLVVVCVVFFIVVCVLLFMEKFFVGYWCLIGMINLYMFDIVVVIRYINY